MRTRKRNIEKEEYEEGGEGMRKTKEEEQGGYPIYRENERSKVLTGRPVGYIWLHLATFIFSVSHQEHLSDGPSLYFATHWGALKAQ